jgi:glycerol kinase
MPIALDLGSSSAKVLVVDRRGRLRGTARRAIATRRARGGRVEHDAEGILAAALQTLRAAGAAPAPGASDPRDRALAIATQRSTVLFWDRNTGRPLTPAYSWQDLRGAPLCARLRRHPGGGRVFGSRLDEVVAKRTGLRLSPHYAAAKIAWALRHVRGLRRRVAAGRALWGTLGTFVVWRMSHGAVYAIDHANAQRTSLQDLASLSWDPDLFALFGLEALLEAPVLPALVPTFLAPDVWLAADGVRRPGDASDRAGPELRLAAVTGDQQAALLGLGCSRPGDVAINYGSGAFVLRNTGARPLRVPGLLTSLLASWRTPSGVQARYAVEGPVNAAATAIDWVARRLRLRLRTGDLDRFLGADDGRPRRVHFLPAVAGLGAPRWDPAAQPRFAGDLTGSSPRDLVRAVVESIAYRCAEILRLTDRAGPPAGRAGAATAPILAAGGLTRCRALLQAQADLAQRPVLVRDSPDATAWGAALMALRGPEGLFGVKPGRETGSRGRTRVRDGERIIAPRISREEAEARYRAWARAVYGRER